MVTARNFHPVSWSWRREQSRVCYFSLDLSMRVSSCHDALSRVPANPWFIRTAPALRDSEWADAKNVQRLRLSGSIHAWINTWDTMLRRDNYGARKSDNQGRREKRKRRLARCRRGRVLSISESTGTPTIDWILLAIRLWIIKIVDLRKIESNYPGSVTL